MPNLREFSRQSELSALQDSVYREWFEFARLSPILWCANKHKLRIQVQKIKEVSNDFGDVWRVNFRNWASVKARELFPEQTPYDRIEILEHLDQMAFIPTPQKFAITVPMTIRRQTLMAQFRKLLEKHHLGRKLDVLKVSHTAKYKIHTRQYRKKVLENERLVLVYRWIFPNTPMWVIADRLQLSPSNKVRDESFSTRAILTKNFARLNSIGGRHLYKAKRRVMNLELGSFPNASSLDEPNLMPFAKSRQDEFISLTQGNKGTEKTKWRKWLEKNYFPILQQVMLDRNRVKTLMLTEKQIKDFLSGKTHQI